MQTPNIDVLSKALSQIAEGLNVLEAQGLTVKAKQNTVFTEAGIVFATSNEGWVARVFVVPGEPLVEPANESAQDY